ncbi:MAG: spore maturation protein [Oscillibacter sp.]|jgi:spore maturation protein B|nr:spore maturation protein [Oscillibacter sp.]
MSLSSLVVPLLLAAVAVYAMGKRVDVYAALTTGAGEGLRILIRILPALVGLLTAVSMFRASGALEWLTGLCAPVMEKLGIPPELTPLMLIRPVSGNGALAVGSELMHTYGADSYVGRVAAVMLGSTETTFYTIAVYFGSAGIRRTRHTIPAAITADLAGFLASAFAVRLFFGR